VANFIFFSGRQKHFAIDYNDAHWLKSATSVNNGRRERSLDCQHEQVIKMTHVRIRIHCEFV
jgi:hypothetical protein